MSLRLETLQIARLAPKLLDDSAELVRDFVLSLAAPGGGFVDRAGEPDLYYTVFGIECLLALQAEDAIAGLREPTLAWLCGFLKEAGELDLVHHCCLIRAFAGLESPPAAEARAALLERLAKHRSADGGFDLKPGAERGTVYAAFLCLGAYEDLGEAIPEPGRLLAAVEALRCKDHGYANDPGAAKGLTPPTAAAVALRRRLGAPPEPGAAAWLLDRCLPEGGFFATPAAPLPDLLSTATALHALTCLDHPLEAIKEPCLDYVDSLWTNRGSFFGHWQDDALDVEYTWYGLLALGHLSL